MRLPQNQGLLFRVILSVTVFLLTALGLETTYRLWLFSDDVHSLIASSRFFVYNDNIVKSLPSLRYGYEYNRVESSGSYVRDGRVVRCTEQDPYPINASGNPGAEARDYDTADLRILFFGDSFSAFSHGGKAYPNLVEDRLTERLGRPVSILNFGRGGYGVLQAFDLARDKIEELEPDLAVFAFIAADLTRPRFWIKTDETSDALLYFRTTDPEDERYDPARHRPYYTERFPQLSVEWCREQLEHPDPQDERLQQLLAERQRLLRDSYRYAHLGSAGFWDWSQSYLWNRLGHGHALHRATRDKPFEVQFDSFDEDAAFVDAVNAIRRQEAPLVLVHLPGPKEIRNGQMMLGARWEKLKASLETLTGVRMLDLAAASVKPSEQVLDGFWVPHDGHPSREAMEFYATATAELLTPLASVAATEREALR